MIGNMSVNQLAIAGLIIMVVISAFYHLYSENEVQRDMIKEMKSNGSAVKKNFDNKNKNKFNPVDIAT